MLSTRPEQTTDLAYLLLDFLRLGERISQNDSLAFFSPRLITLDRRQYPQERAYLLLNVLRYVKVKIKFHIDVGNPSLDYRSRLYYGTTEEQIHDCLRFHTFDSLIQQIPLADQTYLAWRTVLLKKERESLEAYLDEPSTSQTDTFAPSLHPGLRVPIRDALSLIDRELTCIEQTNQQRGFKPRQTKPISELDIYEFYDKTVGVDTRHLNFPEPYPKLEEPGRFGLDQAYQLVNSRHYLGSRLHVLGLRLRSEVLEDRNHRDSVIENGDLLLAIHTRAQLEDIYEVQRSLGFHELIRSLDSNYARIGADSLVQRLRTLHRERKFVKSTRPDCHIRLTISPFVVCPKPQALRKIAYETRRVGKYCRLLLSIPEGKTWFTFLKFLFETPPQEETNLNRSVATSRPDCTRDPI